MSNYLQISYAIKPLSLMKILFASSTSKLNDMRCYWCCAADVQTWYGHIYLPYVLVTQLLVLQHSYTTFSSNSTNQLLFIVWMGQTSLRFLHSSYFLTDDPMMTVHMMVAKEQHSILPHVLSSASLERTCHQTMMFSQVLLICFIHNIGSWFQLSCKCREKLFLSKNNNIS